MNYTALSRSADRDQVAKAVATRGGTSLAIPVGVGVAAFALIVAAIYLGDTFGSDQTACSSGQTVKLVREIVVEQMQKSGLGMIIDIPGSSMSVDAIRTQASRRGRSECSAEISFRVKSNGLLESRGNGRPDPAQVATGERGMSEALKQSVTYTSELTDNGAQIYVTVRGLNLNR